MTDIDPTSPWYEFISYLRCCESLEISPSVQRFMAYQRYLRYIGVIE